eukprot:g2993.t1
MASKYAGDSEPSVDISGEWILDLKRSQSMDEVLKLLDVGWLARKAADNMGQTVIINQKFPKMEITYKTLVGTTVDSLEFGKETSIVTNDKRTQKVRHHLTLNKSFRNARYGRSA